MSHALDRGMSAAEFYRWLPMQLEGRFELVDGGPVMMAGANNRHDRITRNALRNLGNHLDGHRCQPFTADIYIAIPAGNRRQADVGIDCGEPDDESMQADQPAMVLEVLSPTTRAFDRYDKLEDYKTVQSMEYIVLVDPDYAQVRMYRRDPDRAWISDRIVGLDGVLDLPMFDLTLSLEALYAGLRFTPRPTLVQADEPTSRFAI